MQWLRLFYSYFLSNRPFLSEWNGVFIMIAAAAAQLEQKTRVVHLSKRLGPSTEPWGMPEVLASYHLQRLESAFEGCSKMCFTSWVQSQCAPGEAEKNPDPLPCNNTLQLKFCYSDISMLSCPVSSISRVPCVLWSVFMEIRPMSNWGRSDEVNLGQWEEIHEANTGNRSRTERTRVVKGINRRGWVGEWRRI